MKIDKKFLNTFRWYEDIDGNIVPHDDEAVAPPDNAVTMFSRYPFEITKHMSSVEGGRARHVADFHTHIGGGNQDIILAMANSGDYTLGEALILYSECCERCSNVLAHKYTGGKEGYPEYSEEWMKCNTACRFCEAEAGGAEGGRQC